ncbi:sarcosine oxidase subunit gamma [Novosphingobium terrae]|uniref:sarcosine oxidase subunit gamma n=1 Tax=Novosphingobium terrae TaxID=2726189 RepID=UPI00197CE73F|nr:sarcosine oxidase subunit gamma family protein [Novosphingobium terrae]
MSELTLVSPAASVKEASSAAVASPFTGKSKTIAPLGHFGRAVLRVSDDLIDTVSERLGITLPREANRSATQDDLSALWLGPDEWLLISSEPHDGWASSVQEKLGDALVALVDVSHRQVALGLDSPHVEDLLASGCALDLRESAFPVGACTRTMYDKAEVVLWRTGAHSFHIEVWRSFARYVEGLLRIAEEEG